MAELKSFEVDVWIEDEVGLDAILDEFDDINDIKYDGSDIITVQETGKRFSLFFRLFKAKEINFPKQVNYQLNNCWELD